MPPLFSFSGYSWLAQQPTPKSYWFGFMPLAQFSAGVCLAYLALEFFRHARVVNNVVQQFLAPTAEERRTLSRIVWNLRLNETENNKQLVIIVCLYDVCEARNAWVHKAEEVLIGGNPVKREDALKTACSQARRDNWFQTGAGKIFLSEFLTGADMLLVGIALTMALWIHILATAESFTTLYAPGFFHFAWWGWVQTFILLFAGVGVPLFYVTTGRSLMDQIREIQDKAAEQLAVKKASLDTGDLEFAKAKETEVAADAKLSARQLPVVQADEGPRPTD